MEAFIYFYCSSQKYNSPFLVNPFEIQTTIDLPVTCTRTQNPIKHFGSYYMAVMMIMTNDDNSEGLFSIVQAKITVRESDTKKN